MKTCKDCIHYDVCAEHLAVIGCEDLHSFDDEQIDCKHFKDKALVLDIPVKMGQTCYKVWNRMKIIEMKVVSIQYEPLPAFSYVIRFNHFGKLYLSSDGTRNEKYSDDIYFTREAAEQALKESESDA